ncbi:MAG TPA: glycosyltransferase family 2 protein [Chthoniobacteraceae bacterium]
MNTLAAFAFWAASAVLAYTFVGYRILIAWFARRRPAKDESSLPEPAPTVCAVVVAYNEERKIGARVENLLAAAYPAEKLRVLVVSDGSDDGTVAKVTALENPRASAIALPERRGKAAGLNAALAAIDEEIVVFTDSRQQFPPETIAQLAAHFGDPQIGAASGSLEIRDAKSSAGQGIGAYWQFEKAIRADESRWDSCIGCTGAVYAIRRAAFTPIPEDTVLDDVVIPMQIARQGFRVVHDPSAIAVDPQPLEPVAEQRRKRRTLAGNFQMLFRYPQWLAPGKSRLWWQLLSHKYLRLAAPVWLAVAFVSSATLLAIPIYRAAFFVQAAMYGCALAGLCFPTLKSKAFSLPAGFVFLNFTTLQAFWHYLNCANLHQWQRPASREPTGDN